MAGPKRRNPKGQRGGPPRGPRGAGRRMPPPDATGREVKYIRQLKESVTPLVVHLVDGTEVRGHIEYYDVDMIKVTRPEGPHFFIRKSDIRYIVESD